MTNHTDSEQSFTQLLLEEIAGIKVLLDLLQQEYQLLQSRSPELLEALTRKKQQQIENLNASVNRHNSFLQQMELPADREGVVAFLQQLPLNAPSRAHWHEFQSLLEGCRKQNEINGSLLVQSQRQASQALDLLLGINPTQKTYGPAGESRSNHLPNSLGKA